MPTKLSRYCEGVIEASWLAAVVLIPLFFNIYSSRIFEPDKITILRSLALIILAAWAVKVVDEGRLFQRHAWKSISLRKILNFPLAPAIILLVVVYLLATIFSVTPRISFWGSYQRLQGTYTTLSYLVVFAAMLGNIRRKNQVDRLITTIIVASVPVCLYGFLQRYNIDPIPWGGDVIRRIAANMGNSIFVAAYLIMVFPLVVGRMIASFRAILKEETHLPIHVVRATLYTFIALVQVIAIYMSGSRGPALGWLLGVFVLFLLLSWYWSVRWLTLTILGAALLGIVFLGIFNIPSGPLENLRNSPAVGRFGKLLDAESNSALVRKYIWEGTVDLVSPHDPIMFPDGSSDRYNLLRPLIGYGPESMYVAFNPFYVPELGQVEKRNASPDRSHNETWDSIVITGVLGLIAYLSIFLSVFYYGLSWIGLIPSRRHFYIFAGLCLVGGILGTVLLGTWRGVEYIGLGLPLGIIVGLLLYLAYTTTFSRYSKDDHSEYNRVFILIILLAAIIAHFIEINFGIAIAVTRTYFWVFSGLLVVVGYLLPRYGEYIESPILDGKPRDSDGGNPARKKESRNGRAKRQRKPEKDFQSAGLLIPDWLKESLTSAGIITLILVTLGFDYITNSERITSALRIIFNSLSRLPTHQNALSFGVLMLVLFSWLVAALLLSTDNTLDSGIQKWLVSFLVTLGVSALFIGIFWMRHALGLAVLASQIPSTINEVVDQVSNINYFLTHYYLYILILLLCLGFVLPEYIGLQKSENTLVSVLVSVVLIAGVLVMVYLTNLRVIHADITFKMGEPFNRPGQWEVATHLYQRANSLVPDQDHYYLFLGRSYLERAKEEDDPKQQEVKIREAEEDLKFAQSINPLNTDHSANLARLYSWWATQARDTISQKERGEIASRYYETALTLSPNNSTLLGESALLYLDVLGQPKEAYARLQRALDLDQKYNWTQGLMGDFYLRVGKVMTDTQARKEAFTKAIEYYSWAVELSKSNETQLKISFLAALADAYMGYGSLDGAIQAYQEALSLQPRESDLWRIEQAIASLYLQKGDRENALNHALHALSAAPDDQKPTVQSLIDEINRLP